MLRARGVLACCFFMLGLGLYAPKDAVMQGLDYFNASYGEFYPSRVLATCNGLLSTACLFFLFFKTDAAAGSAQSKRARLLGGYATYTFVLTALPILDTILHLCAEAVGPQLAQRLAFSMWALGMTLAGGAEAIISLVVYGEAGALGSRYTHAFIGGRSTCGLIMATLRCLSKVALGAGSPQSIDSLRKSTGLYLATAALIVLACPVIVLLALPRLKQEIAELRQHKTYSGVALQLQGQQQQLQTKAEQPQLEPSLSGPLRSASSFDSTSPLVWHALTAQDSLEQLPAQQAAAGSTPVSIARVLATQDSAESLLWLNSGAISMSGKVLAKQVSFRLDDTSPCGCIADRDCVAVAGATTEEQHTLQAADCPGDRLGALQLCIAADYGSHASDSSVCITSCHHRIVQQQHAAASPFAAVAGLEPGLPPPAAAAVVRATAATGDSAADGRLHKQQQLCVEQTHHKGWCRHASGGMKVRSVSFSSLPIVQEGASHRASSWLALRVVWPFMLAMSIALVVPASVFPLCLSPQIGQWPAVGSWQVQLMLLTTQLGVFVGSAALPIWQPHQPRRALPAAAVVSAAVYIPAFALALVLRSGPPAFLALGFGLYFVNSYLCTSVYCLASKGLASEDASLVQQLLVLNVGVSNLVGAVASWLWLLLAR